MFFHVSISHWKADFSRFQLFGFFKTPLNIINFWIQLFQLIFFKSVISNTLIFQNEFVSDYLGKLFQLCFSSVSFLGPLFSTVSCFTFFWKCVVQLSFFSFLGFQSVFWVSFLGQLFGSVFSAFWVSFFSFLGPLFSTSSFLFSETPLNNY